MSGRSGNGTAAAKRQALLCAIIVVPIVEAVAWAVLRALGGDQGAIVFAGIAAGAFCGVYAVGPARWLSDPDIAGRFGRDHPYAARLLCLFGVAVGFGVAALAAAG